MTLLSGVNSLKCVLTKSQECKTRLVIIMSTWLIHAVLK